MVVSPGSTRVRPTPAQTTSRLQAEVARPKANPNTVSFIIGRCVGGCLLDDGRIDLDLRRWCDLETDGRGIDAEIFRRQ